MPTPLLAYPFALAPTGDIATVEAGTDEQYAQELAVAILTGPDERDLAPGYGLSDPTFNGFEADALRLSVLMYGPPVTITNVTSTYVDDRREDVTVAFSNDDE